MKKSRLRGTSTLLCLCVCFLTISSIAFLVLRSQHDCTGEGCPICSEIDFAISTLQTLADAIEKVALSLVTLYLPILLLMDCIGIKIKSETSVTLKVKLNN